MEMGYYYKNSREYMYKKQKIPRSNGTQMFVAAFSEVKEIDHVFHETVTFPVFDQEF